MDKDKNRILIALPPDELRRLMPWLEPVTLLPGEALAEFEQPVSHIYFPQSAILAIQSRARGVGFVETCTVGREGAFGLVTVSGSGLSIGRVVVQIAGRALRVRADVFREILAASPGLQDIRTRYTEAAMILMAQSIACKTLHSVEERLCRWLLTCRDRTGSDTIPLTQEALAESLGVQRTTITAAARNLQNRGLIRYRRGVIECVDLDGLLRNSCECYGILRDAFSRLLPYTYVDPPARYALA
ncbi:MAG: Crp/Fnr family transcriptional regulator [Microvirga sp.]|nr:Crp/Fnr family transcriptional regulator [Microvirga sp.]